VSSRDSERLQAAFAPDIEKVLKALRLPGVDMEAIIADRRADISAARQANKLAYEGMKTLAKREVEMLREAVTAWRSGVKELRAAGGDLATQRTELAVRVIQTALTNVRELAEAVTLTQSQAWDPIATRLRENFAALQKVRQPS
jgi:hypothetical protein